MNAPISQREIVTCYVNHIGGDGEEDMTDVYVVFKSGVVMYNEVCGNVLTALNMSANWAPSGFGERHVRDIFEFVGYFPAPCKELI